MPRDLKKIDLAKQLFAQHIYLFACPLCGTSMDVVAPASLRCENRHTFDLARQGYINLLASNVKPSKYDRRLFTARLALNQSGFYSQLLTALEDCLAEHGPQGAKEPLIILDAGCGEGSHLAQLVHNVKTPCYPVLGVGLDIAKDGIRLAAGTYTDLLWCVADLTRSPLQAAQCDVILNILSPANYGEFKRLLRPNGIVIKVFPGPDYLKELRTALYAGSSKATYENEEGLQQFQQQFQLLAQERVYYQRELTTATLEHLLRMTPLAWNADQAAIDTVRKTGLERVTIDLTITVGKLAVTS